MNPQYYPYLFAALFAVLSWVTGFYSGRHAERDKQQRKAKPPKAKAPLPPGDSWDYQPQATANITKTLLIVALSLLTAATAYPQAVNISTRGRVGIFQDVLIAGFILQSPATVVIRALGPSLVDFGVEDTLPDPTLAVYDENRNLVAINDDWITDPGALNLGVLTPTNPLESATTITLPAGKYTAIVAGFAMCEGRGLVEVYVIR